MVSPHQTSDKKSILIKYLPLFLSLAFIVIFVILMITTPETERRNPPPPNKINVQTLTLAATNVPIIIRSHGLIAPRIESKLVAQVSGKVITVSDAFRDGGFFKKNELLVSIEQLDYRSEVDVALANLAVSERTYQEELALTQQAEEDWKRLGSKSKPSDLTLRKPQLLAAKATVTSARSQLNRAKLNLKRTQIVAPFDGRVRNKNIDVGQVVGTNAILGEIYAIDAVEVKLPIKNSELSLLNLPETHRDSNRKTTSEIEPTLVKVRSTLLGNEIWNAKIVRTAGAIDSVSRQLSVTAEILDPYGPKNLGKNPLKIGEYVTADIAGKVLLNVIAIPNKAIYQGTYVYVYRDAKAFRQDVTIYWQDNTKAVIKKGLNVGDKLIITPLGQITSGTAVTTAEPTKKSYPPKKDRKPKPGMATSSQNTDSNVKESQKPEKK